MATIHDRFIARLGDDADRYDIDAIAAIVEEVGEFPDDEEWDRVLARNVLASYIAVTPGNAGGWYGTGQTVDEARQRLRAAGGNLNRVVVFQLPEGVKGAFVDGFGVRWYWINDDYRLRWDRDELEVVQRRGVKEQA